MIMMPPMQDMIRVPALIESGKIIVPEIWLGRDLEYRHREGLNCLSAAEYNSQMQLPTLAELRHAFFDKNADGSWVCPDYRKGVISKRGCGEWPSTFNEPRKPHRGEVVPYGYHPIKIINRPERVFFDFKRGWIAEYDSRNAFDVLEPHDGWTLRYCRETGYPEVTSSYREDAKKKFGDDASYFFTTEFYAVRGLGSVLRFFNTRGRGRFCLIALCGPDYGEPKVGSRSCRRS